MSKQSNIEYLLGEIRKMERLLANPEPGLFSWKQMYHEQKGVILDFWSDSPSPMEIERRRQAKGKAFYLADGVVDTESTA